jgi:PEP-CTERM motif
VRAHLTMVAVGVAALLCVVTEDAMAQYRWTPQQIQGLGDVTTAFGGDQLSTINSITSIPLGIELNVTFRVGQNSDPFAPDFGATFARVSLAGGLGFPGLDLSAFNSSAVVIESTVDFTLQSFLQTDFTEDGGAVDDGDANPGESFSFLFWENNSGVSAPGPVDGVMDFSMGTEFDGNWGLANPQQVQGLANVRQWGMQLGLFNNPPALGQPMTAIVRIYNVPEPTTLVMVGLSFIGTCVLGRRRK